jgi:hypothetical protein
LEPALFPQEEQASGAGAVATLPKLGVAGSPLQFKTPQGDVISLKLAGILYNGLPKLLILFI